MDQIVRVTIEIDLFESIYCMVQLCSTTFQLWKTLSGTYEKVAATKIYLIQRLYNLWMEESDSVQTYLNEYESINSHISAQGMMIED